MISWRRRMRTRSDTSWIVWNCCSTQDKLRMTDMPSAATFMDRFVATTSSFVKTPGGVKVRLHNARRTAFDRFCRPVSMAPDKCAAPGRHSSNVDRAQLHDLCREQRRPRSRRHVSWSIIMTVRNFVVSVVMFAMLIAPLAARAGEWEIIDSASGFTSPGNLYGPVEQCDAQRPRENRQR